MREAILFDCMEGVQILDPSVNALAEDWWSDRIEVVNVKELHHTHSDVCAYFKNGDHNNVPIYTLLEELKAGTTKPFHLPCLVAARWQNRLMVIFGNRRLLMLKEYQQYVKGAAVMVRVIVHNVPRPNLQELDSAFIAKFKAV